jgi:hypothetical protein
MNLTASLKLILAASVTLTASSCAGPDTLSKEFERFEGKWISEDENGSYIEVWRMGTSAITEGYAYTLKGSDSTFHEMLAIAATDSGIYYLVNVPGQNGGETVGFKMAAPSNSNEIIFENASHDFPKKISYTFTGSDSIHVVVSGDNGRSFDLNFRRSE